MFVREQTLLKCTGILLLNYHQLYQIQQGLDRRRTLIGYVQAFAQIFGTSNGIQFWYYSACIYAKVKVMKFQQSKYLLPSFSNPAFYNQLSIGLLIIIILTCHQQTVIYNIWIQCSIFQEYYTIFSPLQSGTGYLKLRYYCIFHKQFNILWVPLSTQIQLSHMVNSVMMCPQSPATLQSLQPNGTKIYAKRKCWTFFYKNPSEVCEARYNGCVTIWEIFSKTVKEKPTNKFLGTRDESQQGRPYKWKTFSEIATMADNFARGIHIQICIQALSLSPDTEGEGKIWQFFGIFSKNREEWAVADLACIRSSVTIVPFYDSLGMEALSLVINLTNLTTMSIERASIPTLLKLKTEGKTPSLKNLVIFEEVLTDDEKAQAVQAGLSIYSFKDVLLAGQKHPTLPLKEPSPDTIHLLCFTSGTTGDAKGAKLTHSAFISNIYAFDGFSFTENDVVISYLPYAHAIIKQLQYTTYRHKPYSIGYDITKETKSAHLQFDEPAATTPNPPKISAALRWTL